MPLGFKLERKFPLAELVEALASLRFRGSSNKPGLAPAGDSLSFASPKERKQRKGDPMVRVLPLRSRQPAVLDKSGVSLELAFGSDNREP
ncbi:hypothetical protein [Polaromonas sp.]|uniref:hypothetical protein n=1 Tax=Polaromonas sp. TaxID=1869339 RepID=UPI002486E863|nr:hypothetical protein [Polaromonas sp.]MDI1341508.1 hypothetical protein [Polaromonas sp.]